MQWPKHINKVICGDCLQVMRGIPDNSVDIVVTSPPYNANLVPRDGKYCTTNRPSSVKYVDFSDDLPVDQYVEFQCTAIREMLRVVKNHIFYNIQLLSGNKRALPYILSTFCESIKEIFIWDKGWGEPAMMDGVVNSVYEFIIVFSHDNPIKRSFSNPHFKRGCFDNVLRVPKRGGNQVSHIHSATMPILLASKLISTFSERDDIILDPFLGSGTTAVAAKELGRRYIGIDIVEDYCKVANDRLRQGEMQLK